jgi:tRNA(Ser,Leu) C12 N-acetylase TAN1
MRALGIFDSETIMLMDKCTLIKLLLRTELKKKILVENIENRNREWWMYNDIQKICEKLGIEPEEVCFYPDKTREKLKERFFESNEVEMEIIQEIKMLLSNYNYKNKRILVDLIKLNYNQEYV